MHHHRPRQHATNAGLSGVSVRYLWVGQRACAYQSRHCQRCGSLAHRWWTVPLPCRLGWWHMQQRPKLRPVYQRRVLVLRVRCGRKLWWPAHLWLARRALQPAGSRSSVPWSNGLNWGAATAHSAARTNARPTQSFGHTIVVDIEKHEMHFITTRYIARCVDGGVGSFSRPLQHNAPRCGRGAAGAAK